ncbi:MAG: endonuclease domain-containing protein [Burkholderiales bacterium]
MSRYGITTKDRDALLLKQRGRCAGCHRQRGWAKVIDHCHKTKKVRGILCHHCNLVLGHVRDNPNTLRRLACYLEK